MQSSIRAIRIAAVFALCHLSLTARSQLLTKVPDGNITAIEGSPSCVSYGSSGYKKGHCLIRIDRASPVTPPSFLLPLNTTVYVEVINARPNEQLAFTIANTKTNPLDPFAGAVKAITSPLASLVLFQSVNKALHNPDQTDSDQDAIAGRLNNVQVDINHANSAMTCLAKFQFMQDDFTCSQAEPLTNAGWDAKADEAITLSTTASTEILPIQKEADLSQGLPTVTKACGKAADQLLGQAKADALNSCDDLAQMHATNEARIKSTITSIQNAQAALLLSLNALNNLDEQPPVQAYQFTTVQWINSVVTVSGMDIVLKTTSSITTATVNAQATHWVISSGIGFSTLKAFTYANAPNVVNGMPVLDASGKVTTVVTSSDNAPSIITPNALVSFRLNSLSRANWELKCRGSCAFLLTGGIGANLTSKTADFDTGASFQMGSVMFTPSVHFGRESRLSNGVYVGEKLGSSPPSLTTHNVWVRKFGFSITYVIPTPVTGQ